MALNFKIRQLNSPFDDSVFFLRNVYRQQALLLDCGRLGNINHTELLSVGDIFVSHTHMDHFYGFDRVIRSSLMAERTLNIYGPEGFINNVDGKFRAYTWNLVEDYNFSIKAIELHQDGTCKTAVFSTANRFVPVIEQPQLAIAPPANIIKVNNLPMIDLGDDFVLEYECFDHRIQSIGYRITEPVHYTVNTDKLADFGERTGPWLGKLVKALQAEDYEQVLDVNGSKHTVAALRDKLIDVKPPQVVTYITDCAPTEANIAAAIRFAKGSSLLIIEAVFLPEDREHSIKKQHLTLDLAKKVYFESKSDYVRFTHFAARYELDKQSFFAKLYEGMGGKVFTKNTL